MGGSLKNGMTRVVTLLTQLFDPESTYFEEESEIESYYSATLIFFL